MHIMGCLNLRSSHVTDLLVYPTPLLNIAEGNGRVVTEAPSLQEGDSIFLVFGFCDNMYPTVRSLALNFALVMNTDRLCVVPSQYQGLNDVKIDRLVGAIIQRYSSDFTSRFAIASYEVHYPICILLRPSSHEFLDMKARVEI